MNAARIRKRNTGERGTSRIIQRFEISCRTRIIFCAALINILAAETVQAFSVSKISTQYDLKFYPATREGNRLLVPFSKLPEKDIEVVVLHGSEDIFKLKAGDSKPVTPKDLANPIPHYAYTLAEGKWDDNRTSYIVAAGKNIKRYLKWNSRATMNERSFPTECMSADKGMTVEHLDVIYNQSLNLKIFDLREQILQSTFDKMTSEQKDSGTWFKRIVGTADNTGRCKTLGWTSSDGDGLNNKGIAEALGPIYGIIELTDDKDKSSERWLVLDANGYEIWGYTFIEILSPSSTSEPKRIFLEQDEL